MLTNCLAACAHLTISVSEIERDICEKIVILSYPLALDAPVRGGGSRRNIGIPFGAEKLEWCRYQMVKKFRRYVYSFWRDPRTWRTDEQTDRQTLRDSKDRAYASHRAVKIGLYLLKLCSNEKKSSFSDSQCRRMCVNAATAVIFSDQCFNPLKFRPLSGNILARICSVLFMQ